jgi:UDP-glucose 4-epimerase
VTHRAFHNNIGGAVRSAADHDNVHADGSAPTMVLSGATIADPASVPYQELSPLAHQPYGHSKLVIKAC